MPAWSKSLTVIVLSAVVAVMGAMPALADAPKTIGASPLSAQSASHSQAEAVAYANSLVGQRLDFDGNKSLDCVDVAKYYYNYLGVGARTGNGYAYASGNLPTGWTRVYADPQPGDVAAWAAGKGVALQWGHVAIVTAVSGSTITVVQQDSGKQVACYRQDYSVSNPSSYLRPDWPNSGPALSGAPQVSIAAGAYTIRSKIGNRVIDIDNASNNDGANAQIWQPLGVKAQIFNVGWNDDIKGNYIQLASSAKFLDSDGGSGATNVWQWVGNNTKAQNWIFEDAGDGYVYVRNLHGYYLDVSGGENRNGANVWVCGFNGTDAQKWKFVPVSGKTRTRVEDGQYAIRSKVGARVIDVDNAKVANEANAQIWQPLGNAAQIFNIGWNSDLEANYMQLAASGKFLDAANGDGQVNVWQFEGNGTYAQNWFFEDAGNGYYYVRNLYGYYLDVKDIKDANGTNVQTWAFNGSDAQKWKLCKISGKARTKIADGAKAVQSKLGKYVLDVEGASSGNEANVRICKPTGSASQTFNIGWNSAIEANYLQLAASGKFIDAAGGDGAVNVWQFEGNGGKGQNWFFEAAGDGWYFVRNLYGYYLTVEAGRAIEGQNVVTAAFSGSDAQKWKLADPHADSTGASSATKPQSGDRLRNTLSVKAKPITITASKLKKKPVSLTRGKAFAVKNAKGQTTFKVVRYDAKAKKKIFVGKSGTVRIGKGLKRGSYAVKVKIKAKGTAKYHAKSKTVWLKVKVR